MTAAHQEHILVRRHIVLLTLHVGIPGGPINLMVVSVLVLLPHSYAEVFLHGAHMQDCYAFRPPRFAQQRIHALRRLLKLGPGAPAALHAYRKPPGAPQPAGNILVHLLGDGRCGREQPSGERTVDVQVCGRMPTRRHRSQRVKRLLECLSQARCILLVRQQHLCEPSATLHEHHLLVGNVALETIRALQLAEGATLPVDANQVHLIHDVRRGLFGVPLLRVLANRLRQSLGPSAQRGLHPGADVSLGVEKREAPTCHGSQHDCRGGTQHPVAQTVAVREDNPLRATGLLHTLEGVPEGCEAWWICIVVHLLQEPRRGLGGSGSGGALCLAVRNRNGVGKWAVRRILVVLIRRHCLGVAILRLFPLLSGLRASPRRGVFGFLARCSKGALRHLRCRRLRRRGLCRRRRCSASARGGPAKRRTCRRHLLGIANRCYCPFAAEWRTCLWRTERGARLHTVQPANGGRLV
mmetsp:Transcript_72846/g.236665  ORF Transcript_72846/g.236665 Transcript_72846/m.236665 type:complete len:467 (+) Transcript_72846:782-2182(+)